MQAHVRLLECSEPPTRALDREATRDREGKTEEKDEEEDEECRSRAVQVSK